MCCPICGKTSTICHKCDPKILERIERGRKTIAESGAPQYQPPYNEKLELAEFMEHLNEY